jgi:hemerythrin
MPDFNQEPLKRHEALAPFSRDHYSGLVQAQHLIKASEADDVTRRKAVADFVDVFDNDIAKHFDDEERLLVGRMSSADEQFMLNQHRQIRQDVERIRSLRRSVDPDKNTLAEVGKRLNDHIRWEERELFDRLQNELGDQEILALQKQTSQLEASRPRNICRSTNTERPRP